MNQYWQVWQSILSPEDCKKIVNIAKTYPAKDGVVGGENKDSTLNNIAEIRDSTVRWLPKNDSKFSELTHLIRNCFDEANARAFGFDLSTFYELQFTEYHATSKQHYDWHTDCNMVDCTDVTTRKLSMVIQLSDPEDYEGGVFELGEPAVDRDHNFPLKQELFNPQGSLVVFPSFIYHRVTPVTKGTRYSLVSWSRGPQFR